MADDPSALEAPADLSPHSVCEGGDLDCGSGLLLLIRRAMAAVPPGEVLEIRSTERSVREDLPAWSRMTGNPYLGWRTGVRGGRYFVRRGGGEPGVDPADPAAAEGSGTPRASVEAALHAAAAAHRFRCRATWQGGLSAKVYCRTHAFEVAKPVSFDLDDAAPTAVEYLLGALGAALAGGFALLCSQRGIEVRNLEVTLAARLGSVERFLGVSAEGNPGLTDLEGRAYVEATADESVLAGVWQEALDRSPLCQTLARGARPSIDLQVVA